MKKAPLKNGDYLIEADRIWFDETTKTANQMRVTFLLSDVGMIEESVFDFCDDCKYTRPILFLKTIHDWLTIDISYEEMREFWSEYQMKESVPFLRSN